MSKVVNFKAMPFGVHTSKNGELGGVTMVALPINDYPSLASSPAAYVAIAQCSPKDCYSRGIGRRLSIQRAEEGEGVFIQFPKTFTPRQKIEMLWAIAKALDPSYY